MGREEKHTARLKPKGARAAIVERHHQVTSDLKHRLLHQACAENLAIDFSDGKEHIPACWIILVISSTVWPISCSPCSCLEKE